MSFGFGSGGFGQNNTNQSSTFGGFGSNTNTGTGFGAGTSGFGAGNTTGTTGGGLFGSSTAAFGSPSTGGGFGSAGGFGAAKPFGTATTSSGGGLFGASTTATAGSTGFGSGGFGSNTASNTTGTSGFGGGSLFGGAKPATTGFGSTPTTTSGFGSGTTGLFNNSSATTGTGFGATNNPGLGAVGDPPGTAQAPFTAYTEKEANNPTQSNSFQSILFMEPYKKWSTEELRLVDYAQGRKLGSAGGTGAFGSSGFGATGFGANTQTNTGFGASNTTGTGLFGASQPAATTGFGATSGTTGFGSTNTGGGLFGAAKPATGGLFGATSTPAAQTGGGLFGNSGTTGFGATNTASTGFGAANNNNNTTGGGLFGSTNTTTPAGGGLFGAKPATTGTGAFGSTTTGGFGANNTATNTGGGLFGNTAGQTNTTGGGLFGNNQQQQPATTGFGANTGFGAQAQNTGGGLFGAAKPATGGLFGSSTPAASTGTGGGLFGNTSTQPAATGFGTTNTAQPAAGGLFGAKPAATTGGLFGNTNTAQPGNTGGGLFGLGGTTQTQQPATGGGLFGSLGQSTQQKPNSLFGASQPAAGTSLFGGQNNQQSGGLFGASTAQQQPQAGGLGSSLFGATQNQQQAPQSFSTSITDLSAYGSATLFTNLPDDKVQNPGPLATPLSGASKVKSRSILPMYKLSPANASRMVTPQKRGFGFSYSAYGSPAGSPSSAASTPGGFGQSLLAGGKGNLSKSLSVSNLRRNFSAEDSILAPGAFSASTGTRLLGNSHKKLVINRDMRSDLFTSPHKDKQVQDDANGARKLTKRVSFDTSNVDGANGSKESSQEPAVSTPNGTDDSGYLKPSSSRPSNGVNGAKSPVVTDSPEMEQVKGNELAVVVEEGSPVQTRSEARHELGSDEPGAYWMTPTAEEIMAMNRKQREKVSGFIVGREHVGSVAFKVPVDLSGIDLNDLFGTIVILEIRSATVYPVQAKKPPVGKGLNVPSLISLEHSWPRGGKTRSEAKLRRHIERLKSMEGTEFVSFDPETGVWEFSVEHFTTYGLIDSDDEDDADMDPPTPQIRIPNTLRNVQPVSAPVFAPATAPKQDAVTSPSDLDDTFEFRQSRRAVPGAFDKADTVDDEELSDVAQQQGMHSSSPLHQGADAPLPSREWPDDEDMADGQDLMYDDEHEAIDRASLLDSVEQDDDMALADQLPDSQLVPAGIMRARMRAVKKSTAPTKIEVAGGDDWTQILQASVRAPRTVDRQTLRELNETGAAWDNLKDRGSPAPTRQQQPLVSDGAGFATSIDLMKSLFEQAKGGPTQPAQAPLGKGFVKWPYQKRAKLDNEDAVAAAACPVAKPNWGPNEVLVTATNEATNIVSVLDGAGLGASLSTSTATGEGSKKALAQLQQYIDSWSVDGPARVRGGPDLKELAQGDSVWELAALLFIHNGANLNSFWKALVADQTDVALSQADSLEEKVIISLAGNRVADACALLIESGNYRLATLVSSIGSASLKSDIKAQLQDWRDNNVLADMTDEIRAIYELLAGNACVCAGVKNVPIENRIDSFLISERFGLGWMLSFGLRLFYGVDESDEQGFEGGSAAEKAVRSFQADVEQDREEDPVSPLWSVLRMFGTKQFDWGVDAPRLGWLLTRAIYETGKVNFGQAREEKLDMASLSFAAALTARDEWVAAAFVLLNLSDKESREKAVRDHLGRHANLIGSPFKSNKKDSGNNKQRSPFSALKDFGVPEGWIWEAKALDYRFKGDTKQEFLALVWAGNYAEATRAFVGRVGPDLVVRRDLTKLYTFAELLYKVGAAAELEGGGALVYLLYPLLVLQKEAGSGDIEADRRLENRLLDGLVALRGATHGDLMQEAAIADMAEELIKVRSRAGAGRKRKASVGGKSYAAVAAAGAEKDDVRLYQLLPEDVRGRYMRARALETLA